MPETPIRESQIIVPAVEKCNMIEQSNDPNCRAWSQGATIVSKCGLSLGNLEKHSCHVILTIQTCEIVERHIISKISPKKKMKVWASKQSTITSNNECLWWGRDRRYDVWSCCTRVHVRVPVRRYLYADITWDRDWWRYCHVSFLSLAIAGDIRRFSTPAPLSGIQVVMLLISHRVVKDMIASMRP